MIPYACKLCGRLDEEGILGHSTNRCQPMGMVANAKSVVANMVANVVANKSRGVSETVRSHKPDKGGSTPPPATRTKDRHKNKEARLKYARNLMRERRAAAKHESR